jgi:uncharacterized GH25 family protein
MSHYTLVRNGKVTGTKALTDAMADRLAGQGVELIPVAEPVRARWVPGRVARQVRLAQERPAFADVIAGGRRG